MGNFRIAKSKLKIIEDNGRRITIVDKNSFDNFNEDILGLGKIETESKQVNALSVFFDLEGFTNFCKQIDPQLAVPEYLSEFLKWIFDEIRSELTQKEYTDGYSTWADLPFLSKYLGDGILFLWDTSEMSDIQIRNVVVSMLNICNKYKKTFLPKVSKSIASPPTKLRCGIARGAIYTVGDGNDFVGPCINMSARLQKLNTLSFCFSRRGIDPEKMSENYKKQITVKKVDIRGIGSEELVCILSAEYDKLESVEKKKFIDPA